MPSVWGKGASAPRTAEPCRAAVASSRLVTRSPRSLLDHLVGGGEESRRHVDTELFRGLGIDDQLVLGRGLNRKVGGLLAFENAVHVACCAYVGINRCWPVGEETATMGEIAERIDRR